MGSSFSSETSWMYDVFLSFRGADTRLAFTGHLYMALNRAGVRTFMDSNELRKGEDISSALIGAIKGSRFHVIVFSQNYAGSRWCLDELLHIMECNESTWNSVFPIFYKVEPGDVRHQQRGFGKAFKKHEARETQDKISRWRSALERAGSFSGFKPSDYRTEAEMVTDIIDTISTQLNKTYLQVAVYPVGIDSRVEDISKSLCVGVDDHDVRMIGILGMGGSGKSSVAKAIYNKFWHSFENKSFLGNVRETAKMSQGKITLQERLLSDICQTKIEVGNAAEGINLIKERLGSKKVLVVVDDVDDDDQLNALALRRHDSFGPGSRIIITTRDQHVLELLNVDATHPAQLMKVEEAMELLSWHAFQNPCIDSKFSELSRRVVSYCGGLPFALEVLGSFLYGKDMEFWKSTLDKLEKFPDNKIQEILRISFDALDEDEKGIFLHISCFFVGMDKKHVLQILHGCGYYSEVGIRVLLQRCLVTVSEKNKLMMHDLLRDMGREVVRIESPNEPEERTRLWHQEDVIDVLTDESGTKKIQGLALNLQRSQSSHRRNFKTTAFSKMDKLKLLQLNYVQLDGRYGYLSKQLRWLCLRGFSLSTIGDEFPDQNLVCIDLRYSHLIQVWEQPRFLKKLKILNLSHSHYLTHTPDFSKLPNLEFLILKDCRSLSEIDKSIGCLTKLRLVNLKDCIMLKDLPKSFYELKSVETLVLSGCSRFQNLSDDMGNMESLTDLVVSGTAISQVPSSLANLKLNNSSLLDLSLVKLRFPDVPKYLFPAQPQVFTASDIGSSSVHSLVERPDSDLPTRSRDMESDDSTALAMIPSSSEKSRQSILQAGQLLQVSIARANATRVATWLNLCDLPTRVATWWNLCDLPTRSRDIESDDSTALAMIPSSSEMLRQSFLQVGQVSIARAKATWSNLFSGRLSKAVHICQRK